MRRSGMRRSGIRRSGMRRSGRVRYKKGDDKEEKVGKRGRGMTMNDMWKKARRRRGRRGG